MAEKVKKSRPYDSPRRREQASATRRAMQEAALRLFKVNGYTATTMELIASETDVSLKTVYLAFGTKSQLLRSLWDLLLKGDEEQSPVALRAWFLEVINEHDAARALELNARNSRAVKTRIAGLLKVIREAATTDGDAMELWTLIQTDFHKNQATVVESIASKGGLRAGLTVEDAADILWTLNHPDIWFLLVEQRGWTAQRFEMWLAESSIQQLLEPRP